MKKNRPISRREFLSTTARIGAGAVTAPLILSGYASGAPGPNDRINVAYIGVGRRGNQLMGLPKDGQIVAYADVNVSRLQEMLEKNEDARIFQDYREMLQEPDIDAVVIATPDHWHALHSIHACEAAKDVYVEKPMTLTIREGRAMVDAARKHGRIVQCGSQQRSMEKCRFGCELIRNGRIGTVHTIHGANYPSPWACDLPEEDPPAHIDWDMWCGQTEPRGYHPDLYFPRGDGRKYPDGRPYGWISYTPYSGGEMTGWGAHGLDIIQWAMGTDSTGPVEIWADLDGDSGPVSVFGKQIDNFGDWPEAKMLTSPVSMRYADGALLHLDGGGPDGGAIFEGDSGKILVDRDKYDAKPNIDEVKLKESVIGELPGEFSDSGGYVHLYRSEDHLQNWFDCIRSRNLPIADVEIGHRSATMCHLGNIARWTGRKLRWDPENERFVDDDSANGYLERPMRAPWQIT
jgi:predicted dehydrogenase